MKRKLALVAVLTSLLCSGILLADATVYIVHGVPGTPVDVYLNGAKALENFEFKDIAGPVTLPAGSYDIDIYLSDADPATTEPVLSVEGVPLVDDQNVSLVAHLTEEGGLRLTGFGNDVSPLFGPGARLAIRHTAKAPTVDVKLISRKVFPWGNTGFRMTLSNSTGLQETIFGLTYEVQVGLPGAPPLMTVPGVPIFPGEMLSIFAVGSLADGTFDLVVLDLTQ